MQKGSDLLRADSTFTKYRISGLVPRVMASTVAGVKADFSTQSASTNEPVVSVDWLHANLKEPDLKVTCVGLPVLLPFINLHFSLSSAAWKYL